MLRQARDGDPDSLDERLAAVRRAIAEAGARGDRALADAAHPLLLTLLVERGDLDALEAENTTGWDAGSALGETAREWNRRWFRFIRALLDGQLGLAAELEAAMPDAAEPDVRGLDTARLGRRLLLAKLQGHEEQVEAALLAARRDDPRRLLWTAHLAALWARGGRDRLARGALGALGDPRSVPRDRDWLPTLCLLAEAAVALEDRPLAASLRELLRGYPARLVPVGEGSACWGTVAQPLARLARLLGDPEEALGLARAAADAASRVGALCWLAESLLELVSLLRERGGVADEVEADAAVRELMSIAARIDGAAPLERELAQLASAPAPVAIPPPASGDRPPRIELFQSFRVVGADGQPVRWTSRKARELLKLLLARRGAAVTRDAASEILWPDDAFDAANRLSVAITAVRRALDPARRHPADSFLATTRDTIRIRLDRVEVDTELFLAATSELARGTPSLGELVDAVKLYRGEALADEPYADWAAPLREECATAAFALFHAIGEQSLEHGRPLQAVEAARRALDLGPWDDEAHRLHLAVLDELGLGRFRGAIEARYRERADELTPPAAE